MKDNVKSNQATVKKVDQGRRKALGKLAYTAPAFIALGHIKEVSAQLGSPPCPPNNPHCP